MRLFTGISPCAAGAGFIPARGTVVNINKGGDKPRPYERKTSFKSEDGASTFNKFFRDTISAVVPK
jgi:hypothetical protein